MRHKWEVRRAQPKTRPWGTTVEGHVGGVRFSVPVEATCVNGGLVHLGHRYFRPRKPKDDHLEMRFALIRHAASTGAVAGTVGGAVVVEAHYAGEIVEFKALCKDAEARRLTTFQSAAAGIAAGAFPAEPAGQRERECPRCPFAFTCPA